MYRSSECLQVGSESNPSNEHLETELSLPKHVTLVRVIGTIGGEICPVRLRSKKYVPIIIVIIF